MFDTHSKNIALCFLPFILPGPTKDTSTKTVTGHTFFFGRMRLDTHRRLFELLFVDVGLTSFYFRFRKIIEAWQEYREIEINVRVRTALESTFATFLDGESKLSSFYWSIPHEGRDKHLCKGISLLDGTIMEEKMEATIRNGFSAFDDAVVMSKNLFRPSTFPTIYKAGYSNWSLVE